jgi:hypothetical protein
MRTESAIRALAEENAAASPDVVDHVNNAWLCACGHICSGDSHTIFGYLLSESATVASRTAGVHDRPRIAISAQPDVAGEDDLLRVRLGAKCCQRGLIEASRGLRVLASGLVRGHMAWSEDMSAVHGKEKVYGSIP